MAEAGPGTRPGTSCSFPFTDQTGTMHLACALGGSPGVPGSEKRPYCYGASALFVGVYGYCTLAEVAQNQTACCSAQWLHVAAPRVSPSLE